MKDQETMITKYQEYDGQEQERENNPHSSKMCKMTALIKEHKLTLQGPER